MNPYNNDGDRGKKRNEFTKQSNAPLTRLTVSEGHNRRRIRKSANCLTVEVTAIRPLPNQLVFEFDGEQGAK